jgi:peptidyl-prolyl cis-trans isomerase SurA
MKLNLKKIFIIYLTIFLLKINYAYPSLNNKILVKVGNEIITSFEIENKIKTIIFFSGQKLSQQNVDKAKRSALKFLIDTKLMQQELKKFNINLNDIDYNNYLNTVASQINVENIYDIKDIFEINEIDYNLYLEEVKINLSWQRLIYQLYSSKINIDEDQIANELNKIVNENKYIDEFELSEIELIFSDESEKDKLIDDVLNDIKKIGFEETAYQISSADSSSNGGKLGWINSQSLSDNIKNILTKLNPGEISPPIISSNSILFLKIINKRQISNLKDLDLDKLKNSIIDKKTDQVFKMYSKNYLSKAKNTTIIKYLEQ